MVFQQLNLFAHKTIAENVMLGPSPRATSRSLLVLNSSH